MKTPTEAYDFAKSKVIELQESGIEVKIIPSSKSKSNENLVKEYNKPERIPPELWEHVSFLNMNKSQAFKVHEMANYLGMCGIKFDMGGSPGFRDWEFDWSFVYIKGEEDWEWRDAREDVEEQINNEE